MGAAMRATAFGLDIDCPVELAFLSGSSAQPTGRAVSIAACESEAADARVAARCRAASVDERGPGDTRELPDREPPTDGIPHHRARVRLAPALGGRRVVARATRKDGPTPPGSGCSSRRLCHSPRLLHGTRGLPRERRRMDGDAVAFIGSSHAGKTSLALELCGPRRELPRRRRTRAGDPGGELLAHPGSRSPASIAATPLGRNPSRRSWPSTRRERIVRVRGTTEPTPSRCMFFLDRRLDGPQRPRFEPSADAQLLLAATFNFVLSTPERLQRLLDVCALASRLRVERIVSGPSTGVAELAEAVERRLDDAR